MMNTTTQQRAQLALAWAQQTLNNPQLELVPLTNDASFRRYFRIQHHRQKLVLMDAPPPHENIQRYLEVARAWKKRDLPVPDIIATDPEHGWLIQTDFGNQHLIDQVQNSNYFEWYTRALVELMKIQINKPMKCLSRYTEQMLQNELDLFASWYCADYLKQPLTADEQLAFAQNCHTLISQAQQQPQVIVHRDYHSRNLMVLPHDKLGIIDFQDAVVGPFTYDIVSLLRDAYVQLPEALIYQLLDQFCFMATQIGGLKQRQLLKINEWFDLTGLQRHLKILGIFARLHLRDGKSAYLNDIPAVLSMVKRTCHKYSEFKPILDILSKRGAL